jgi:hypothetical protein
VCQFAIDVANKKRALWCISTTPTAEAKTISNLLYIAIVGSMGGKAQGRTVAKIAKAVFT